MKYRNPNFYNNAYFRFANEKPSLMNYFNVPRFDVPELIIQADEAKKFKEVWFNVGYCGFLKKNIDDNFCNF